MSRPNSNDPFIKNAIKVWTVDHQTFVLIKGMMKDVGFRVRVFPHYGSENSFWLGGAMWEGEAGAALSILNYLNREEKGLSSYP